MSETERYGWSEDGERFTGDYATRALAAAAAADEMDTGLPGTKFTIWTARRAPCTFAEFFPPWYWLAEQMGEAAGEEVGEIATDWPPGKEPEGAEAALHALLEGWAATYGLTPKFWRAVDIEAREVVVT